MMKKQSSTTAERAAETAPDTALEAWREDRRWLHRCQRISLAAAEKPVLSRVWPALSRGLRQYWARQLQDELLVRMPGDLRMAVRLTEHVEAGVFWYGFPAEDRDALTALQASVPDDAVLFDVGANVGCFTLALARHAPRGTVHAFEPVPETRQRLQHNIARNALGNVVLNDCALSNHSGSFSIWVPRSYWKGRLLNSGRSSRYVGQHAENWSEVAVRCVPLDDYVQRAALKRLDAIKIDVEGAEMDVLEGARESLRTLRPVVVMELNHQPLQAAGRSVKEVLDFWRQQDYRVGTIAAGGSIRWRLPAVRHRQHCNILCLPAERDAPAK